MSKTAYNDTPADLPNRIREERKAKGLTLEEMAELTGISWQTLQRYETGVRRITLEKLGEIAASLGVSTASLVRDAEALSREERELLDWIREHPRDRRLILSQLRVLREGAQHHYEHE